MKLYRLDHAPLAGYVADEGEEIAYVADPPPGFTEGYDGGVAYVAEDDAIDWGVQGPYGGVAWVAADAPVTTYVTDDDMGDDDDEMAWVAEDDEDFAADEEDFDGYYGEDELADDGYDAAGYGEEPELVEGYVRETREPAFSPRVVPVTQLDGYVRPKMINPTVETLRPAEEVPRPSTEWFKPLW